MTINELREEVDIEIEMIQNTLLEWDRMKEGTGHIEEIFKRFRNKLFSYLQSLN